MKTFNYPTLKVSGPQETVDRFLEIEYTIWEKDRRGYQWEFINLITGLSKQLKGIVYFKRKCLQNPDYLKTIEGLIHQQIVADNLEFEDPTPDSNQYQDDNYLASRWFESRLISRFQNMVIIAYDYYYDQSLEFWKQYLIDVYVELKFEHSSVELESIIHEYKSRVIYNHGCEIDDEDYPEESLLSDLDLI